MVKKAFYIEQRDDGRYNVSHAKADKPEAVTQTQAKGIAKARSIDPEAAIHVERVRNIGPGRDKWRKI
jgi:hypothetical protein